MSYVYTCAAYLYHSEQHNAGMEINDLEKERCTGFMTFCFVEFGVNKAKVLAC